ncbi:hypothetical protein [Anaerorhabdus sp.]|uniref:hypothetical protein n=1 Tax=Anaerorhabdus sp. TaxID=1872524 RepID=UPI002FCBACD4
MQNNITDLNNHLFAQLERLGDEELTGEALEKEIGRAKAVVDVAKAINDSGALALCAQELIAEYSGFQSVNLPVLLEPKEK